MPLTIDDETDRVAEQLAARLRIGKIEAMRVALDNELCLHGASFADDGSPPRRDTTELRQPGQDRTATAMAAPAITVPAPRLIARRAPTETKRRRTRTAASA